MTKTDAWPVFREIDVVDNVVAPEQHLSDRNLDALKVGAEALEVLSRQFLNELVLEGCLRHGRPPDLAAAEEEARHAVLEMAKYKLRDGLDEISVEVRDGGNSPVLTATASVTISRVQK